MNKKIISNLQFNKYFINNIDFNFNHNFETEEDIELDIDMKLDTFPEKEENQAAVELKVVIFDEAETNNYPFTLEINIVGFFSAGPDMKHQQFVDMCRSVGAATLFPYVRSAITDITKIANVNPLTLPLINVEEFLEKQNECN